LSSQIVFFVLPNFDGHSLPFLVARHIAPMSINVFRLNVYWRCRLLLLFLL